MDSKQPEQPGHERIASQKDATDAARLEAAAPAAPGTHAAASVEVKQEDRAPLLSSTPTLEPFVAAPDAGSVHLPAAPHKGSDAAADERCSPPRHALVSGCSHKLLWGLCCALCFIQVCRLGWIGGVAAERSRDGQPERRRLLLFRCILLADALDAAAATTTSTIIAGSALNGRATRPVSTE